MRAQAGLDLDRIGNVLAAELERVALAGRALLRRSLRLRGQGRDSWQEAGEGDQIGRFHSFILAMGVLVNRRRRISFRALALAGRRA